MTDPDLGLILNVDGEEPISPELRGQISWAHAKVVSMVVSGCESAYEICPGEEPPIVAAVLYAGDIYTAVVMGRVEGDAVRRSFIHCEGAFVVSGSITRVIDHCNHSMGTKRNVLDFAMAASDDLHLDGAVQLLSELTWRADPSMLPGVADFSQI